MGLMLIIIIIEFCYILDGIIFFVIEIVYGIGIIIIIYMMFQNISQINFLYFFIDLYKIIV